ncbi:hypothetical protein PAXRUDRAFT_176509, partial [Paxillus rubicundulus Ve08.2h10]
MKISSFSLSGETELPKALLDALLQLASQEEINQITAMIHASLENMNVNSDETVELKLDDQIDLSNWTEGVEELHELTVDQLWEMLGLPEKKLPFFQEWTDPDMAVDAWSKEGQAWLKDKKKGRQPLVPRWHQLVGIYRVLERAFEGKPVLLMDGVGLGKTLQGIGAVACLAYYKECFDAKGSYPGHFSKLCFHGPEGKIPDLPHIIVCPVNLRDQWEREIKWFLSLSSFDHLPYTGWWEKHQDWWDVLFSKSHQPLCRTIILATYTASEISFIATYVLTRPACQAVQDDATRCFRPGVKGEAGRGIKLGHYQRSSPQTLYGRCFGMMIMDEAHQGRKYNLAHVACRELRLRSSVLIALTATPVTTKPQDLWIMGDLMGIEGFADQEELLQLNREINSANRRD